MSVTITIKGTPIDFPSSGESPNWSPAVIQFAQAVEEALLTAVGPDDVPAQVFTLTSGGPAQTITNLSFSTATVRAAYIKYSIILIGTSTTSEAGNIIALYNGSSWNINSRDYVGEANCTFSITSLGQVTIQVPSVAGFVSGKLSFSAQALQQNP